MRHLLVAVVLVVVLGGVPRQSLADAFASGTVKILIHGKMVPALISAKLDEGLVRISERKSLQVLKEFRASDVAVAAPEDVEVTYSRSKHFRWGATGATALLCLPCAAIPAFMPAKHHWIGIRVGDETARLRASKKNYAQMYAEIANILKIDNEPLKLKTRPDQEDSQGAEGQSAR